VLQPARLKLLRAFICRSAAVGGAIGEYLLGVQESARAIERILRLFHSELGGVRQ
jgi:hypothetical protein